VSGEARVPFAWPFEVRYLEVDALGVVFNMWYLAYCDSAQVAYFRHLVDTTPGLLPLGERGLEVVLRHAEVDWRGSLRPDDTAVVQVTPVAIGTTSLRLRHEIVRADGVVVFTGQITYVCVVAAAPAAERVAVPVPDDLRRAVGLADISTSR
jgi:acyl-CoA thioester hydrolase